MFVDEGSPDLPKTEQGAPLHVEADHPAVVSALEFLTPRLQDFADGKISEKELRNWKTTAVRERSKEKNAERKQVAKAKAKATAQPSVQPSKAAPAKAKPKAKPKGDKKPVMCRFVLHPEKGPCPKGQANCLFWHKESAYKAALKKWEANQSHKPGKGKGK